MSLHHFDRKINTTKQLALLKAVRYVKISSIGKVKKCPRCGSIRKVKNKFNRAKQRYLCKVCAFNYTSTKNGYLASVRCKALQYYL